MVEIDSNGLEVLAREECLALLSTATLGRVGATLRALPTVLPVNFTLRDEEVVFCTGAGSKLDAAVNGAVVAFEVDDFDPIYHSGWSVVVTGVAREVTQPEELEALEGLHLSRWAPVGGAHLIAIPTEVITGRRLRSALTAGRRSRPSRIHNRPA